VLLRFAGGQTISKDQTFTECVVLDKEAFDPDAVFMDDIVDDEVLPSLSLAVEGLTDTGSLRKRDLEMRPEDAANDARASAKEALEKAAYDPEQLEVYGWESSIWRRFIGYLGF